MASGVKVLDEVTEAFNEIKLGHKWRYVTFRISDDMKEIITEGKGEKKDTPNEYETFLESLPADEPRYVVYDFHYQLADGGQRDDVIMISWCPDTTKVKKKMLHASSKDALVKKLQYGGKPFQATEVSDITKEVVMETLKKGKE